MEEIKNWWGVFGLFVCITVVSSSLERRCHRQGSLATLNNRHSLASKQGVLLTHMKSERMEMCCVSVCAKASAFLLALNKFSCFLNYDLCVCVFYLICALLLSLSQSIC